jgi:mRNA interferase MazF
MPPTTTYERGRIVLVRFPFTDLTSTKQRPALIIASRSLTATAEDLIVAAISGQRVERPGKFDYVVRAWERAGLLRPSVVRAGKLVTLHRDLIRRTLGALPTVELDAVDELLRAALGL